MYTRPKLDWSFSWATRPPAPHPFPPTFEVLQADGPTHPPRSLLRHPLSGKLRPRSAPSSARRSPPSPPSDESTLRDSLHQFTDVYSLVEQNYAEPLDADKIDRPSTTAPSPACCTPSTPTPTSTTPRPSPRCARSSTASTTASACPSSRSRTRAGVLHVVVLAPFEGTPAFKAGIRPGDVILSVDGKSADGLDSAAVAAMLKGPKGTHVLGRHAARGP